MKIKYDVANLSLAPEGKKKIEWSGSRMPVLKLIAKRFAKELPLKGITIGTCQHVTSETANLVLTWMSGGAKVILCASNMLSTQDSVAASLVKDYGVSVFAVHGEDKRTYYKHLLQVLDFHPNITVDDGADLVSELHKTRSKQITEVIGSSEETTTGVIRLRAMEKDQALKVPVIAVNESKTKHMFDNRYGTGQSTVDGILRATNMLLAGKKVVVCGYGWCGRGIANRLRGMGALVTVCEVDPLKALEATMDGFAADSIKHAVTYADLFVTATGDAHVINVSHMRKMKDGAVLANSGHFNVEFDYGGLEKMAKKKRNIRNNMEEFTLPSGKKLYALGEGRLINLVSAEGHPAEVMDMSFANQALASEWLVKNRGKLENKVYQLPQDIDENIATLKLAAMGITIDKLTQEQKKYLSSWKEGT